MGQVDIGGLSLQSLSTPYAALTLPSRPAVPYPLPPPPQVGAGAFMSGVTRLTMALAVIMIEVSSDVHMLLPVLVAVMTVRIKLCLAGGRGMVKIVLELIARSV